jgi:hypothetical protein
MVCGNITHNARGVQQYPAKVHFEDLFFARSTLKNLLKEDGKQAADDEDVEEVTTDANQRMLQAQDQIAKQEKQQYINAYGGGGAPDGLHKLVEWIDLESGLRIKEAEALIAKG